MCDAVVVIVVPPVRAVMLVDISALDVEIDTGRVTVLVDVVVGEVML